jgi:hypothetical protein
MHHQCSSIGAGLGGGFSRRTYVIHMLNDDLEDDDAHMILYNDQAVKTMIDVNEHAFLGAH